VEELRSGRKKIPPAVRSATRVSGSAWRWLCSCSGPRSSWTNVCAAASHNVVNTSDAPLKLYTLYAPPNHRDGVVHHTRADAEADNEHFDGKTTE
jgi:hypothetical protein